MPTVGNLDRELVRGYCRRCGFPFLDQARQGECRVPPACERRLRDPTYKVPPDRLAAVEMGVRQYLVQRVKDMGVDNPLQATITYGDLCYAIDPEQRYWAPPRFQGVGKVLDRISTYEYQAGRPLLSAMAVEASAGHAGDGFMRLAGTLGHEIRSGQELAFWRAQVRQVARYWATSEQVESVLSNVPQAKTILGAASPVQHAEEGVTQGPGKASAPGPRPTTQWTFVDHILVERDDLVQAIDALSALRDSDTIIIKTLIAIGSPLARTHYRSLADEYESEHPGDVPMQATSLKHPPRRRVAFIRLLQQHLHELDARLPLDADLAPDASDGEDLQVPDALSDADARTRAMRDVVARQGQSHFRNALMRTYGGRCAVTGCDSPYALEAAHIRPYRGEHTNVVSNGLLLRADIHTLFDLGLLAVNPVTLTIVLSDRLPGNHYQQFRGTPLTSPENPRHRPSQALLSERWAWFQGKQAALPQTS